MYEIKGSAKLICDYCQRWRVRRFRGIFRPADEWDGVLEGPVFCPNLEYKCPTCDATEFSYDEPKPEDIEQKLAALVASRCREKEERWNGRQR